MGGEKTAISDIETSTDGLITFMGNVLRDTEAYRKKIQQNYQEYLSDLRRDPTKASWDEYKRTDEMYNKFQKLLTKFSVAITQDYLDILTVSLKISEYQLKYEAAIKELDQLDSTPKDRTYRKAARNLDARIRRILKGHDNLAVVYNNQIDKLVTFRRYLEKQLIIYVTNDGRKFVIPVKDYISEFEGLAADDTFKQKALIVSEHLKGMIEKMMTAGTLKPISKLEDRKFDTEVKIEVKTEVKMETQDDSQIKLEPKVEATEKVEPKVEATEKVEPKVEETVKVEPEIKQESEPENSESEFQSQTWDAFEAEIPIRNKPEYQDDTEPPSLASELGEISEYNPFLPTGADENPNERDYLEDANIYDKYLLEHDLELDFDPDDEDQLPKSSDKTEAEQNNENQGAADQPVDLSKSVDSKKKPSADSGWKEEYKGNRVGILEKKRKNLREEQQEDRRGKRDDILSSRRKIEDAEESESPPAKDQTDYKPATLDSLEELEKRSQIQQEFKNKEDRNQRIEETPEVRDVGSEAEVEAESEVGREAKILEGSEAEEQEDLDLPADLRKSVDFKKKSSVDSGWKEEYKGNRVGILENLREEQQEDRRGKRDDILGSRNIGDVEETESLLAELEDQVSVSDEGSDGLGSEAESQGSSDQKSLEEPQGEGSSVGTGETSGTEEEQREVGAGSLPKGIDEGSDAPASDFGEKDKPPVDQEVQLKADLLEKESVLGSESGSEERSDGSSSFQNAEAGVDEVESVADASEVASQLEDAAAEAEVEEDSGGKDENEGDVEVPRRKRSSEEASESTEKKISAVDDRKKIFGKKKEDQRKYEGTLRKNRSLTDESMVPRYEKAPLGSLAKIDHQEEEQDDFTGMESSASSQESEEQRMEEGEKEKEAGIDEDSDVPGGRIEKMDKLESEKEFRSISSQNLESEQASETFQPLDSAAEEPEGSDQDSREDLSESNESQASALSLEPLSPLEPSLVSDEPERIPPEKEEHQEPSQRRIPRSVAASQKKLSGRNADREERMTIRRLRPRTSVASSAASAKSSKLASKVTKRNKKAPAVPENSCLKDSKSPKCKLALSSSEKTSYKNATLDSLKEMRRRVKIQRELRMKNKESTKQEDKEDEPKMGAENVVPDVPDEGIQKPGAESQGSSSQTSEAFDSNSEGSGQSLQGTDISALEAEAANTLLPSDSEAEGEEEEVNKPSGTDSLVSEESKPLVAERPKESRMELRQKRFSDRNAERMTVKRLRPRTSADSSAASAKSSKLASKVTKKNKKAPAVPENSCLKDSKSPECKLALSNSEKTSYKNATLDSLKEMRRRVKIQRELRMKNKESMKRKKEETERGTKGIEEPKVEVEAEERKRRGPDLRKRGDSKQKPSLVLRKKELIKGKKSQVPEKQRENLREEKKKARKGQTSDILDSRRKIGEEAGSSFAELEDQVTVSESDIGSQVSEPLDSNSEDSRQSSQGSDGSNLGAEAVNAEKPSDPGTEQPKKFNIDLRPKRFSSRNASRVEKTTVRRLRPRLGAAPYTFSATSSTSPPKVPERTRKPSKGPRNICLTKPKSPQCKIARASTDSSSSSAASAESSSRRTRKRKRPDSDSEIEKKKQKPDDIPEVPMIQSDSDENL